MPGPSVPEGPGCATEKARQGDGGSERSNDFLLKIRRGHQIRVQVTGAEVVLAPEVDTPLSGQRISRVLSRVRESGRLQQVLVCHNGPEFTSTAMLMWSQRSATRIHHIQPGKPIQNAFCESFIGKLRYECLRQHGFRSLLEARAVIEQWRIDYNYVRPHRSLDQRTPMEVVRQAEKRENSHSAYSG